MALVRIQGEAERRSKVYYEYDTSEAPLGMGGMGKVYKGWLCSEVSDQRREVAIKCMYSDLPAHVIARARREAAVRLRNDSLIEMIGFVEVQGVDQLGQPVMRYHVVSEYLHGVTLDKVMAGRFCDNRGAVIPFAQELYGKQQSNPYGFALIVVRSLLSGLMALHDAGYVHRDIDPSNIMVTADGKIKLIDFGIAKKLSGTATKESSYTVDGQFIGKPKYAAPELVRGLTDSQNATTDLYAVGILLYQLLVGRCPFEGEMAEVLEMQLNKKMPLGNVKQKQIKEVIRKATSKKRGQRYQSAAEFRVAVDRLVPLQYPEKSFNLKALTAILGTAAAVAGIVCVYNLVKPDDGQLPPPDPQPIAEVHTYAEAVKLLSDTSTVLKGFAMLNELVTDSSDYQSTFLLSRLYFDGTGKEKSDALDDSIKLFRRNLDTKGLGVEMRNDEAHRLLKAAVEINGSDYRSLYELGCDYKSGDRGVGRNSDSALIFLKRAEQLAVQAGDNEYVKAIKRRKDNIR